MELRQHFRHWAFIAFAAGIVSFSAFAQTPPPPPTQSQNVETLPPPNQSAGVEFPVPASILGQQTSPIDLSSALRLAGVSNPEILLARERITEAMAMRQWAAAQILPNINAGTNVDLHTGPLQQSNGNILKVNRGSLYLGLGSNAIAAGSVNIPGIFWSGNAADILYNALASRQIVRERRFTSAAVNNDVLLRVSSAYLDLLRAEGRRVITAQSCDEAREVARITAAYAKVGQGRQADADRAASELQQRNLTLEQSEAEILTASARLTQLLSLDPSVRLHVTDGWVVPAPIVPDPVPLCELIIIALAQRPELAARRASIEAALLELDGAKLLPFSPNILFGYSAGMFGGGSNLVANGILQPNGTILRQPRFDSFGDRQDIDAVMFWTLRNLGIGNLALIRRSQSQVRSANLREIETLDRVRTEVAAAYARTHARFAQIETGERAVRAGQKAFAEDLIRTRNREGLPIEVLDSLRLLDRSREVYLDSIIDYNRAQFELYVALGKPPADVLARPVPADLVPAGANPIR